MKFVFFYRVHFVQGRAFDKNRTFAVVVAINKRHYTRSYVIQRPQAHKHTGKFYFLLAFCWHSVHIPVVRWEMRHSCVTWPMPKTTPHTTIEIHMIQMRSMFLHFCVGEREREGRRQWNYEINRLFELTICLLWLFDCWNHGARLAHRFWLILINFN